MDTQNQTLIYTLGMRPKRVKKQPTASLPPKPLDLVCTCPNNPQTQEDEVWPAGFFYAESYVLRVFPLVGPSEVPIQRPQPVSRHRTP